jgi:hypothetical protein
MSSDPKIVPDLPEPLREVLKGLPRTTFSRRPPRTQQESESDVLWEVKDLQDVSQRLAQRRSEDKK